MNYLGSIDNPKSLINRKYINDIVAEEYDSTKTYFIGDYTIHEGKYFICNTDINIAELWNSQHWDETLVNKEITDVNKSLNSTLVENSWDMIQRYGIFRSQQYSGIEYFWDEKHTQLQIQGTATDFSFNNVIEKSQNLPSGLHAGDTIYIKLQGFGNGVVFRIYMYPDTLPNRILDLTQNRVWTIPEGCTGILIRVNITSGTIIETPRYLKMNMIINHSIKWEALSPNNYSDSNKLDFTSAPDYCFGRMGAFRLLQCPPVASTSIIVSFIKYRTTTIANSYNAYIVDANLETGGTTECYRYISYSNQWIKLSLDKPDYQPLVYQNSWDLITRNADLNSSTLNDVTFQYEEPYTWKITGSPTATAFHNLWGSPSEPYFVNGISPGKQLYIHVNSPSDYVGIRVYLYPNILANRDMFYTSDAIIHIPENCTGTFMRIEVRVGVEIPEDGLEISCTISNCYTQEKLTNDVYADNHINLLVFGSSFSYSTLGYLVPILKEISPEISVTLGICYDSGQSISGHIDRFRNQTNYTAYREYIPSNNTWMLSTSITPQKALDRHRWDYVVIQQACRHTSTEQEYQDIEVFADLISGYLTYPFAFLFNMAQVLGANCTFPSSYTQPTGEEKSQAMFDLMTSYSERASNNCVISGVIPCGTAVQNARTIPTFKQMGTNGYLSVDENGHLQNGLPILIPGYCAAYKLLQLHGRKLKLFSNPLNPTDEWVQSSGVPTSSYSTCVGVSNSNKLLAQKCALAAIKQPFELTDFSSY